MPELTKLFIIKKTPANGGTPVYAFDTSSDTTMSESEFEDDIKANSSTTDSIYVAGSAIIDEVFREFLEENDVL